VCVGVCVILWAVLPEIKAMMMMMINDVLNDDADIKREIKNLFARTNMLTNRFRKCSVKVKLLLFESYCMSLYDVSLWKYSSVAVSNKFRSSYNKCIKKLFGYARNQTMLCFEIKPVHITCSMSEILINLSLPYCSQLAYSVLSTLFSELQHDC